jgi:PKD repeat protein
MNRFDGKSTTIKSFRMKNLLRLGLLLFILIVTNSVWAQNWINITSAEPSAAEVTLVSSSSTATVVSFTIPGFSMNPVMTPRGDAFTISLPEGTPILEKGMPDLPKLTTSLIIPDLAQMEIKVISSSFIDYPMVEIAPSKGNFTRDINPDDVPYIYHEGYGRNAFWPEHQADLRNPFIIRDYRGQTILANPFSYNPVTKTLRVYHQMVVEVSNRGISNTNILIRNQQTEGIDPEFNRIYEKHFLNYNEASKYTPLGEQGKMLIICHGAFMSEMTPFVNWKRTIGIPTEIVDVATIGVNSTSIRNYVTNYYNTNGLTFLLLVGDHAQVPTITSGYGGPSDNAYGYTVGTDHYPDLFVGRFSAENTTHVQTQVQRTIAYEQNPDLTVDWFTKGIGIGSSEGPGDDSEYDYQHMRNIRTDLIGYNYTSVGELYDGSQGGEDLAGNPTPAMVSAEINAGRSIINYVGHGSQTSWVTSGFSNSNVDALTNNNKWPFIFSVACVNGDFLSATCFAESWLRATNATGPTGAIATVMSTINQSWNPPMEGQDEMNDILVEIYSTNIKRTFGGLTMNGCMKMNDTYGTGGDPMTDTWTIFGDPSVMVRTDVPQPLSVIHNSVVFIGATQFSVNCIVNEGFACLTINGQIIGTAPVIAGNATINFPALTTPGTMKLALTSYNHIPYIADIEIVPASGPYVVFTGNTISDPLPAGNNNGLMDFNETDLFSVSLKNVGVAVANNVTATLSTSDPYITITDNTESYGNIDPNVTVLRTNAFSLNVANNIPDQHLVAFNLVSTNGTDSWTSQFNITANAPVLSIGTMIVQDPGGNNNGILDPGETANLVFACSNTGHCSLSGISALLAIVGGSSPYLTLNSTSVSLGTLASGGSANAVFSVTASASTPVGTPVDLQLSLSGGAYSVQSTKQVIIGLIPTYLITNGTVTTCTGNFYDSGGASGAYQNSENFTETFYPSTPGAMIRFNFTSFSTESGYDYLRIYNGTSTAAALIGIYNGATGPGVVTASNAAGALTFNFTSDGSVTYPGWEAAISCYLAIDPPVAAFTASSTSPAINTTVTFTDQSTNIPTGWAWTFTPNTVVFVNGTSASSQNPQVQFTAVGQYSVSLTATNAFGSDVESKINYINVISYSYCNPTYTSGTGYGDYISLVQLGSINNATAGAASPYYTYYSSLSTDLTPGNSYTITLSPGTYSSGNYIGVWIDYNQNGVWDTDEKLGIISIGATPATGTITFTVPLTATSGTTRMRVREVWNNSAFDPCSSYSYGETEDYNVNILSLNKTLNLTVLLESLYSGSGMMHKAQNATGDQYPGTTADQVTVELHNASNYANIVYSAVNVNLSTSGQASITIPGGNSGSYYVTVKHRNSIETTTANPVSFTSGTVNYTFNAANQAYGNNLHQTSDGYWAIFCGDVNVDGLVDSGDMIPVDNLSSSFATGYMPEDVNGDGLIDSGDMIGIDNNAGAFVTTITP